MEAITIHKEQVEVLVLVEGLEDIRVMVDIIQEHGIVQVETGAHQVPLQFQ